MDDLIRVDLALVGLDDTSGLAVGETFEVQVIGRDIRPEDVRQAAVVSLYTDITFDPNAVAAQSITYGSAYTNLQSGDIDNTNGVIDELGGFAAIFAFGAPPANTSPVVATVTFEVLQAGASPQISSNAADEPLFQNLLFGEDVDLRDQTTFTELDGAPTATDDSFTIDEDVTLTTNVLTNDTAPNGASLTVSLESDVANGTLDLQANGDFTYTPDANYGGPDSFDYTVTDGGGRSDTATVSLTVTPVNDAPIADDESVSTAENTAIDIDVLTGDTDSDGDVLSVDPSSIQGASGGTTSLNADGTITYTPNVDFSGSDSFTYDVTDGQASGTGTVTVNVSDVNDAPVATVDAVTGNEDTTLTGNVLTNDIDADGDALTATLATDASDGSVTLNPDGSFEYAPNADFNGSDSFTYSVSDGTLADTGTVNITVDPVNDAPIAVSDNTSTNEDTAVDINVLGNDIDVDGDIISATVSTGPGSGTATVNADGTIAYTPSAGFSGSDSFEYTVSDGVETSAPATVTVNVSNVNKVPVAVDDAITLNEDTSVADNVLGNDTDADNGTLTAAIAGDPSNGSVVLDSNGSFVYTPDTNFNGSDSFTYTVSDGEDSDTGTVNITVAPVNDAPVAVADTASTRRNTATNINVLANDTDADGPADTLTASISTAPGKGTAVLNANGTVAYTPNAGFVGSDSFEYTVSDGTATSPATTVTIDVTNINQAPVAKNDTVTLAEDTNIFGNVLTNDVDDNPASLTAAIATNPTNGSVTLNSNGSFEYTPKTNFSGSDTFTYTLSDGRFSDTGTVNVTVTPASDAPIAVSDSSFTNEDTAVNINVLNNDVDPDGDPLSPTVSTAPGSGSAVVNADGTIAYTPNTGFSGSDSFEYTVSDGTATSAAATVTVTVNDVNKAPVANSESITLDEDATATGNVLANDTDADGNALTATLSDDASNGSVTLAADGNFVYTPNADFNGSDSFTYTVSDGELSDTGAVSITVTPVNDAPVTVGDSAFTNENTAVNINVLANDTDIDSETLSATVSAAPDNGSATINADGTIAYTPNEGFSGSDSFEYTVSDGTDTSAAETVTVNVSNVNEAPVATNDAATTAEDTAATGNVLANDTDPDGDGLTATRLTNPRNGSVVVNADGSFVYTPNPNFNGTDTFSYTVTDGDFSDVGVVDLTVTPVNDNPLAAGDDVMTDEDSVLRGSLFADNGSGRDRDPDGNTLSIDQINGSSASVGSAIALGNGSLTVNTDGTFAFNPSGGYESLSEGETATESFTYTVADGDGGSNTATVNVTINGRDEDITVPTVEGRAANSFIDDDGQVVGNAFQAGQPYNGILFTNTDSQFNPVTGVSPDDVVQGTEGDDSIWTGIEGNDLVDSGAGNDLVGFGAGNSRVIAGSGDDFVYATAMGGGDNEIDLGAGNDNFYAIAGNNQVMGTGNNTIGIGTGNDTVTTFGGDDIVYSIGGGGGTNTLNLGEGDNVIWVEMGDYTITTGAGDDIIGMGNGTDVVRAGDGNNTVYLVNEESPADGNKDILTGSGGDFIQTGSGDDLIDGGLGTNTLLGGSGADIFTFRQGAYNEVLDFELGVDKIKLEGLGVSDLRFVQGATNNTFLFIDSNSQSIGEIDGVMASEISASANFV